MIIDRTQQDVDTAIQIRDNKVKQFISLTETEKEQIERGTLTINTLNRIEAKQQYLADMLNLYAYPIKIETKSNWNSTDLFDEKNHLRILQNLLLLKEAFYVLKSSPDIPKYLFGFIELNSVEQILVDIEFLANAMSKNWAYMGEYYMGGI